MTTMHRTQISLKDYQYQGLLQEAQGLGISLSELCRRLIDQHLQHHQPKESFIGRLAGIGSGAGEAVARHHDRYLYGEKR